MGKEAVGPQVLHFFSNIHKALHQRGSIFPTVEAKGICRGSSGEKADPILSGYFRCCSLSPEIPTELPRTGQLAALRHCLPGDLVLSGQAPSTQRERGKELAAQLLFAVNSLFVGRGWAGLYAGFQFLL